MVKKCPYCGAEISRFTTFKEKNSGEHFCPHCKKESKIMISKKAIYAFFACVALSVVLCLLILLIGRGEQPFLLLLAALPIPAFYLISPLFVMYRPYRKYKEWMTNHNLSLKNKEERQEAQEESINTESE